MKHSWLIQQPLALLGAVLALSFGFTGSGQETQRQYLSGHSKDDTNPWQFLCTAGAKSGQWTTIPVPSNWEMHGFGTLNYFRDDLKKPVEQGQYKHTFTAPAHWSNQRVQLVFDGVMTDTRVTVNGQSAGPMHQGSFYRFRYDVTRLLKFGQENLLEVTVDKLSANESVRASTRSRNSGRPSGWSSACCPRNSRAF